MKTLRLLALAMFVFAVIVTPILAQTKLFEDPKEQAKHELEKARVENPRGNITLSGASVGAGLGAAITLIGAGYGFGRIGASALESMARQPEAAGNIQTGMIIIAALLEGATFFALIICIILQGKATF
jgi:F-type H+-transporting ATPase subunit c